MNHNTKAAFDKIKAATGTFKNDVLTAMYHYRQTEQAARKAATAYKDEDAFISEKLTAAAVTARNSIKLAESTFTASVGAEISTLKDDLQMHLTVQPSPAFITALTVYSTFSLVPSRVEIDALLKQAGGNSLSLRALNAVLQKTGSPYRISVPTAKDFENDIATLSRLAEGNFVWEPDGYHREAVGIYGNTPHLVRRDDGSYVDVGHRWDSVSILTSTNGFNSQIKSLEEMANRWNADILPTVLIPENYPGHTDPDTGEEISGAEEFVADYENTAHAAEVVRSTETAARQMGIARAETLEQARETIHYYAGARE